MVVRWVTERLSCRGRRSGLWAGLAVGVILSLSMFLVISAASFAPAATTSFPDVPDTNPYSAAIGELASKGIIGGYSNGDFGPNDPVTRQQFAKMIVLAGAYPVSESDVCIFTDVAVSGPDSFYPDNYVAVCAAKGIVLGKDSITFDPTGNVTRYQAVSMAVRLADDLHPSLLVEPPAGWSGTRAWTGDSTHGANAARADYNGLLRGIDLDAVDPAGRASRGEVAQLLANVLLLREAPPHDNDSGSTPIDPGPSVAPISIVAVGDTVGYRQLSAPDDPTNPLRAVPRNGGGDLFIFNCEGPLVSLAPSPEHRNTFPSQSSFWGYGRLADHLRFCDANVASLANNHVLDYGEWGLDQTISELHARGIQTVGAGRTAGTAGQPLTLEIGDYRVAVLSYLAMDATYFFAGESTPGAAAWSGSTSELRITEAAEAADIVVVCLHVHYGSSWVDGLPNVSMSIIESAMDAGADIVLVSGSHITQGVLVREGRVALLGLGNFLFEADYSLPANARHSLVARLTVDSDHIGVRLMPLTVGAAGRPAPASFDQAMSNLAWVARVSAWSGTTVTVDDGEGFVELDRAGHDPDADLGATYALPGAAQ